MKKLFSTFTLVLSMIAVVSVARAQDAPVPANSNTTSAGGLKMDPGTFTIGARMTGDLLNWTATLPAPNFGVFVAPNLEVNFTLLYRADSADDGNDEYEESRMGLSLGANYYLPFRGNLYLNFGGAFQYFNYEDDNGDEDTIKGIILTGGLAYAFNPNFVLEGGLSVHYLMSDNDYNDVESTQIGLQLGYIGIKGFF